MSRRKGFLISHIQKCPNHLYKNILVYSEFQVINRKTSIFPLSHIFSLNHLTLLEILSLKSSVIQNSTSSTHPYSSIPEPSDKRDVSISDTRFRVDARASLHGGFKSKRFVPKGLLHSRPFNVTPPIDANSV